MIAVGRRSLLRLGAAGGAALAVAIPAFALAGRPPTPEERARIEAALRNLGYVAWEEIEFEDGVWEVDDARMPDGTEYDLKLRPETFEVIERERG